MGEEGRPGMGSGRGAGGTAQTAAVGLAEGPRTGIYTAHAPEMAEGHSGHLGHRHPEELSTRRRRMTACWRDPVSPAGGLD